MTGDHKASLCGGSSLFPEETPILTILSQTPHASCTGQLAWQPIAGTLNGVHRKEASKPLPRVSLQWAIP